MISLQAWLVRSRICEIAALLETPWLNSVLLVKFGFYHELSKSLKVAVFSTKCATLFNCIILFTLKQKSGIKMQLTLQQCFLVSVLWGDNLTQDLCLSQHQSSWKAQGYYWELFSELSISGRKWLLHFFQGNRCILTELFWTDASVWFGTRTPMQSAWLCCTNRQCVLQTW